MSTRIRSSGTLQVDELPAGSSPAPVGCPHFPDRLHAYVWRNWQLVPLGRLAKVVGATPEQIREIGQGMGLSKPPRITPDQRRRSYLTVIRRNWHLLPYGQLLALLGWTAEELAYVLREDDFLFIKLGSLKPACEALHYEAPGAESIRHASKIARVVGDEFGAAESPIDAIADPLFSFVARLTRKPSGPAPHLPGSSAFSPRFCYSYFALYGDPLLDPRADAYPDGYLARLARSGVEGVWLQAVLYKLAPFPWDPARSSRYGERLENLRALAARARKHGIGIYLYLNEPRAMPLTFFEEHPGLKGVTEREYAALCTSAPEVPGT